MTAPLPRNYENIRHIFPEVYSASVELGEKVRTAGPLDAKTAHLIQLGAAVAADSEGAVHSHTRRAVQAGASKEEVFHAVLLLMSTVGFPRTAAAISWVQDVLSVDPAEQAARQG